MIKKLLLSLFVATVAVATMNGQTTSGYWTDYADESWSGNTMQPQQLIVYNAADLARVAMLVNTDEDSFEGKTIKLAADIDLSAHYWVPIGANGYQFKGSFDGQGHTISGLKIGGDDSDTYEDSGLFGWVEVPDGYHNSIRRVTMSADNGAKIHTKGFSNLYVGGLLGYVGTTEASSMKIIDCHNEIPIETIDACRTLALGGLIGEAQGDIQTKGCSNSGNILGAAQIAQTGGLVGFTGTKNQITDCVNSGAISVIAAFALTGGLVGGNIGEIVISNSLNKGSLRDVRGLINYLGGIIGISTGNLHLTNCYAVTDIITDGFVLCGGIAGYVGTEEADDIAITNCFAAGSIECEEDGPIGGIVGAMGTENKNSRMTISNCFTMLSNFKGNTKRRIMGNSEGECELQNNYAYIASPGDWISDPAGEDGADWLGLSTLPPTSGWNTSNGWTIDTTHRLLPQLTRLGNKNAQTVNLLTIPISYVTNGGDPILGQLIAPGNRAIEPETPQRENHFFLGWTADNSQEEPALWDFTTTIDNALTLYALWTPTVAAEQLTIDMIPTQIYTGQPLTPALTVRHGNTTLQPNRDYSVRYEDNVNIGTGCAIVTGKRQYVGETRLYFPIQASTEIVNFTLELHGTLSSTPEAGSYFLQRGLMRKIEVEMVYAHAIDYMRVYANGELVYPGESDRFTCYAEGSTFIIAPFAVNENLHLTIIDQNSVAIQDASADFNLSVMPQGIQIDAARASTMQILRINGSMEGIQALPTGSTFIDLAPGSYIVRIEDCVWKVLITE
ncbi:InlB B-repeat-containing protein [Parabacteroides sp. OttesenSCG-928-N08]|nr:InlB B-repeat-containing protein [Parabacteroides sp. OttesenSCG-928-N08]